MIAITEKAVAKIKEIAEAEGIGHTIVRVGIKGGGCAGFYTDINFDDQISDTDEILEQDGVKIVVDMMSIHYLESTTIDYIDGLHGSGFKFDNPNSKGSCGCGKSVAF